MKCVRAVCAIVLLSFAVFMIMLAAAQSNPVAHNSQPKALSDESNLPPREAAQLILAVQKPPVSFAKAVPYSSGAIYATSVAVGDVNGDGKLDVLVADSLSNSVAVLLGNGDGTFQTSATYGSGGSGDYSIAVGDMNGDGRLDLIAANLGSVNNEESGSVAVLLGNGDGTFRAPVSYNWGGTRPESVAIGDVNGDGYPDLIVANNEEYGSVAVLLGNGDGTFRAPVSYSSGGYGAFAVATADLNAGGRLDIVVSTCQSSDCNNTEVSVLLGNGDGTFHAPVSYSSGPVGTNSVVIGDVNGDGYPDLVAANFCQKRYAQRGCLNGGGSGSGGVTVLLGNGDGTFQAPVSYSSGGVYAYSVWVEDINGDGRPDIVVANGCQSNTNCNVGEVGVLLNNFTVKTTTKVKGSPNPSHVNQTVNFTVTVTSTRAIPDGHVVTFYSGATKIGTGNTANGVATLTTSFSIPGTYIVKASYPGGGFLGASSGTVKQVVAKQ